MVRQNKKHKIVRKKENNGIKLKNLISEKD